MKAHILTIGDELLIGQTINTNASVIGQMINNIDVTIIGSSVVGDNETIIKETFLSAFKNCDILIVTGGLGPTHDDITRKCIADFFETKLVKSEAVLKNIENLFAQRDREVTPANIDQAFVPEIAEIIMNEKGTAPGTWIEKDGKYFVSMPGVPYEMTAMMEDFVIPKLKEITGFTEGKILRTNLLTTGIPESHLYERLGDLDELLEGASLAFLPNQFGVKMRITVFDEDRDKSKNHLTQIEQKIRASVGRYIYGRDDDKLEDVVGRLLIDRGVTISVAESCTGGLISNRLTNISGSSSYFERGVVSYSNGAKVELLRVDEDFLQNYGAVSLEVVRQMAEGVRAISGTDIGLAVTGILGPGGATMNKPVGLVYIGICDEKVVTAREFHFGDDRLLNKDRAAQAAIDMLRRNLLGIPYED